MSSTATSTSASAVTSASVFFLNMFLNIKL
jgi:hypothetical protein